jgi:pSer/pThr/pTyr-binding forkhead associated (FHA) protein
MMPATPAPSFAQRGTLSGAAGIFTVLPGMEMKAGRDGALCQILLNEPRVSGTHATLKIENGQLFVRDDNSNNGTQVNGQRLPPGMWTPVPHGAVLRFGPVEFSVSLE